MLDNLFHFGLWLPHPIQFDIGTPHAVWFDICCCMPYSLLFVIACCTDYYCRHMPYCLLFVAACHTVRYLLPHAVQFAIRCLSCCTVRYLLLHGSYWRHRLLFVALNRLYTAVQFAIGYHMPYCLLFVTVATCRKIVCHMPCSLAICCRVPYTSLFLATWRTVCYLLPHAVQFAIRYHMPYSLSCSCLAVYYLLPHAV